MRQSGKQIIKQGETWVADNPEAYAFLKENVQADLQLYPGADLRIAYYVERIRAARHVKVPNAIQAYLSRRIESEVPGARFVKSKSKLNLLMAGDNDE